MASVAEFLIERLNNAGVKHIFGVRGDYNFDFIDQINNFNSIEFVQNTDENNSALAADAYARVSGIGCVCVTYNFGALKVCNAIAGAYSERSPVVVISGSPSIKDRNDESYFHHVIKNFENQSKIFKCLTCYNTILDDPTTAGWNIDQALESLMFKKQPVYIELPVDVANQPLRYDVYRQGTPLQSPTNQENLNEASVEIFDWINSAKLPVIMAGVQINRYNLGDQLLRFAEKHNFFIVSTLLSKSVVSEHHPLFAGVFSGKETTDSSTKNLIEDSDCLIVLGDLPTDLGFGFNSLKFAKKQMVLCSGQGLKVRNHSYKDINFKDFCDKLFKTDFVKKDVVDSFSKKQAKFEPREEKVSIARFFEKISETIKEDTMVICDVGGILKYVASLKVWQHNFLASSFYPLAGFSIPAALGQMLAKPKIRPIIFINDQIFQSCSFELTTIIKQNLNPIIFVLSNFEKSHYQMSDWNCEKIIEVLGEGESFRVETEQELCLNIDLAFKSKQISIIHVVF